MNKRLHHHSEYVWPGISPHSGNSNGKIPNATKFRTFFELVIMIQQIQYTYQYPNVALPLLLSLHGLTKKQKQENMIQGQRSEHMVSSFFV